jgi:hypothetical protein
MNDLKKIKAMIYELRGYQVMLDEDLAKIYQVETKVLNQAVKRNIDRFPPEFMFQLTEEEYEFLRSQIATSSLRSQFVTSKDGRGGRRYLPFAFTEHGVVMLSSETKDRL